MRSLDTVTLADVQAVYNNPLGDLRELIFGEQIHLGGFQSSTDLADRAGVTAGMRGIDLCCCTGAGMRFLVRFRDVAHMHGVDATERMVELGRRRDEEEGLADRIDFTIADASATGLPSGAADFVWGEDAWCYVADKGALIAEAVRLAKPRGVIAFTDWVEGDTPLTDEEAEQFLTLMTFPTLAGMKDYPDLLDANGCDVIVAEDTGRFAPCMDLYVQMLTTQLTYDALKMVGFQEEVVKATCEHMAFYGRLAHEGKLAQGLFVARKTG